MGNHNTPNEHPEVQPPSNDKSITIDKKNGTIGHISAELGISMSWLKEFMGLYEARPKTYIMKNFFTPGKGEGEWKEMYWTAPRLGEKYILRENSDPTTGKTLIRIRGNEAISIPVPPEALTKKLSSIEDIQDNTRTQLASLMKELDSQTA